MNLRRRNNDAVLGRVLLFLGAYAPAAIIVSLRVGFSVTGVFIGVIGIALTVTWVVYLQWLVPRGRISEYTIRESHSMDQEFTAYLATYLFPVVATAPADTGEVIAYVITFFVILIVAFRADLGAVNPIAYAFGYRIVRVVDTSNERLIFITRTSVAAGETWEVREISGLRLPIERR